MYNVTNLQSQFDIACKTIVDTPFDAKQPAHILAVGLYVRATETAGAVLSIYPTQFHSAILTLGRSLLEAIAQLGFLSKDTVKHYHALTLMDLEETLHRLEDNSHQKADLSQLHADIEHYKSLGVKRVSLKRMLADWGYAEVYESYRFLSHHSHVSLSSIADTSIKHASMNLGSQMSPEVQNAIFGLLVELLKEGEIAFLRILNTALQPPSPAV